MVNYNERTKEDVGDGLRSVAGNTVLPVRIPTLSQQLSETSFQRGGLSLRRQLGGTTTCSEVNHKWSSSESKLVAN